METIARKTIQQQIDHLWEKAWKLADWIDDPDSFVPWQERAAKVPELQTLSLQIDRLIKEKIVNKIKEIR